MKRYQIALLVVFYLCVSDLVLVNKVVELHKSVYLYFPQHSSPGVKILWLRNIELRYNPQHRTSGIVIPC